MHIVTFSISNENSLIHRLFQLVEKCPDKMPPAFSAIFREIREGIFEKLLVIVNVTSVMNNSGFSGPSGGVRINSCGGRAAER